MATIHIQKYADEERKDGRKINLQSVPFKIHADSDAQVNKYFDNYIKCNKNNILECSFRGYPLRGKKVEIPENYVGFMVQETIRPITEKDQRKFFVVGEFSEITYWNWDKTPSPNDPFIQALQWIRIAEALHSPISEE